MYLDFQEYLDSIITSSDVKLENAPENVMSVIEREQAIGERRVARMLKEWLPDYVDTTHQILNAKLSAHELEPEDYRSKKL